MTETIDTFASGSSFLHRADPRIKLAACSLYCIVVAILTVPLALSLALACSIVMLAAARLSFWPLFKRLAAANGLALFLWVVLPWTIPGRPVGHFGPIIFTDAGVARAAMITVKLNAILMAVTALLSTSKTLMLARALRTFRVPGSLIMVFYFCLRYLEVIRGEYERLRAAMKARAFRPGTNVHAYRSYAFMIGMLLVRSHDRAQRVYQAMVCRGFRGVFPVAAEFDARFPDWLLGTTVLMVSLLLVAAQCL